MIYFCEKLLMQALIPYHEKVWEIAFFVWSQLFLRTFSVFVEIGKKKKGMIIIYNIFAVVEKPCGLAWRISLPIDIICPPLCSYCDYIYGTLKHI